MDKRIGFGSVSPSGHALTVPSEVWAALELDNPDAVVEYIEREGEIVLRPRVAVHPDDAWFWSPESQAAEQEAEEDLAAGRYTTFQNEEEFLAHLEKVAEHGPEETG
ncbi:MULTISPECIES: hypothetical protein [Nocardiopsis]|uniref:hypothetical protein n=1 Tax=Nocardiopsis TaxID=2013 RepID=UPI001EF9CA0F|nr:MULTISPECIES: hypothetical protein [Nocardiopsis]